MVYSQSEKQINMLMQKKILYDTVEELPISEELKQFMFTNDYVNLSSLIAEGTPRLQRMEGFTILCFESLLSILEKNQILHLLDEGDN